MFLIGLSTEFKNYTLLATLHYWVVHQRMLKNEQTFPKKRRGQILKLLMLEFEGHLEKEGM